VPPAELTQEMVIKLPADTTDAATADHQPPRTRAGDAPSCRQWPHHEAAESGASGHSGEAGQTGAPISETDAERLIGAICFKTGPPGTIGAELEWLVRDREDPLLAVPFDRIQRVYDTLKKPGILPGAGLLTLEPGGQVELSTAPAKDLSDCIAAAGDDLAVLHEAFGDAGLVLTGRGIDPLRRPSRVLELPRYAAMEEFFDRDGHWGRLMMCSTASVQVCVDAGLEDDGVSGCAFRWRLLHAIGPVLVGAFANSPLRRGQPTGWKCTRQLVWSRLDPGRTRSPAGAEPPQAAPVSGPGAAREHWVRYAMDADVLCVRRPDGQPWTVPAGLSFRDWLRESGRPRGPGQNCAGQPAAPTVDDLNYHLSTLFPPVRPRGHLELRMIDAQPGNGWIVPVSVVSALADDPAAADAAMAAAEPVWHDGAGPAGQLPRQRTGGRGRDEPTPWLRAARLGLADPVLARAAQQCFDAAATALARAEAPPAATAAVAEFAERYVQRGRCPADDVLDSIAHPAEGQP
jgi:ergothioneine biosynthesis glutamate--cysteine ligase EgtA